MAFTKMTQYTNSLTIGGDDCPGFLKIKNGRFEMVSGDESNYDLKIEGTKIILANGDIVLDGENNIITVGGNNLQLDGANGRIIVNDGTHDRVIIGNLL